MLRRITDLQGCQLEARDGTVGKIKDLLFDDDTWTVRYLVANTGTWLTGRRVLLSPAAVLAHTLDDAGSAAPDRVPVDLTKTQIEQSPGIEADRPVSEQQQRDLHTYYGWSAYWTAAPFPMAGMSPIVAPPPPAAEPGGADRVEDPHLRSADHVMGYSIHALDGAIGHVEDFLVDVDDWTIRLIVVDTRNWLPGKKVVVTPASIDRISWTGSEVAVNLTRAAIQESPEFVADQPLDDYARRLSAYYDHVEVAR